MIASMSALVLSLNTHRDPSIRVSKGTVLKFRIMQDLLNVVGFTTKLVKCLRKIVKVVKVSE